MLILVTDDEVAKLNTPLLYWMGGMLAALGSD